MGNQSTVEPPPHPPLSQTACAKRGLRIFRGQPYSREQVTYYLISENKYIFLYIRAFWQYLVVNWIRTGRNSASSVRGAQRLFSVKHLFGEANIA